MSTDDPYAPGPGRPAYDPDPDSRPRYGMQYMRSVQYVFESPQWALNLLWGGLAVFSANLIPLVGQLVWMGYAFDVVETLHTRPRPHGYPDFTFDRFVEYLTRGLWLLLVMLVLMIAIVPIMIIFGGCVAGCVVGIVMAGQSSDVVPLLMIIMIPIAVLLAFVLQAVIFVFVTPFVIRAGLSQDFGVSFNLGWARDFAAKMWFETILVMLFSLVVGLVSSLIGLLLCVVGVFAAQAFVLLVQAHLFLQLYELYLARGGEKIPLKPPTALGS